MSWTREQRTEAERLLNYDYLTQTEETWQEGPYDAVKLALALLLWGDKWNDLDPTLQKPAIAVLGKYSDPHRLWGVLPENMLKEVYVAEYGEGEEWEAQFAEDKEKYGK